MRKNGFTLIELLAVIVILAIIALIATPIILGIINDAREESNERSVELYASAIKNGIAAHQLRTGEEVLPGTYNETNKLPFEPDYEGNVECTSVIISEDGKVSLEGCTVNGGEKEYSYGIEEEISKACTLDDKDGDGVASLSDVVTCGSESFYVMENKNNEITMLAMYNLYVGNIVDVNSGEVLPLENPTGIQSELAKGWLQNATTLYGTLAFAPSTYWVDSTGSSDILLPEYGTSYPVYVYDANSDFYPYTSEYQRILKEDLKVSSASATLISYQQVIDLKENKGNPSWLYSTTYRTGSASDYYSLWGVYTSGEFYSDNYAYDHYHGIRPVVTISINEI